MGVSSSRACDKVYQKGDPSQGLQMSKSHVTRPDHQSLSRDGKKGDPSNEFEDVTLVLTVGEMRIKPC